MRTDVIYLDNAATTRVADEVASVVDACMRTDYGNPSSAHHAGISAEKRIKLAREQVLSAIGDRDATVGDLVWTSGGTESDALGILGAGRARAGHGKHLVQSAVEHPAVRQSAQLLADEGWCISSVPIGPNGVVDVQAFADAVRADTTVVALMLVNNEIGTIMPVAEVARAVRARAPHCHIHCDAVQALSKVDIDVRQLGVDSVAFAAHKLHGPKGVGALWRRHSARIAPLWSGGGQQAGIRSGTFNVPGIAGMGAAVALAQEGMPQRHQAWREFSEILRSAARSSSVEIQQNGDPAHCAPHILSLAFAGLPSEPLLHVLESRGVLVSAGSACAERSRKPSPVLTALGVPADYGSLRFSFGRDTDKAEVSAAAEILVQAVKDL